MKEIDPVMRDKIISHQIAKLSQTAIANSLRVSQTTVSRVIKRFKSGDSCWNKTLDKQHVSLHNHSELAIQQCTII